MAERTTDPLIGAFLNGYMRRISEQMAGLQATQERHLVLTGQILEAIRSIATQMEPPRSGRLRKIVDLVITIHRASPLISWATQLLAATWVGRHIIKLAGF